MIIKISDSNISVFFLDCFRFQVCGNEYNVLLNNVSTHLITPRKFQVL